MKNKYYLYILPLCAIFLFNGKKYDESVIERIHLNVNICIEGQECGEVASVADVGTASKATKLYAGCIACHGAKGEGASGAGSKGIGALSLSKGGKLLFISGVSFSNWASSIP